MSKCEKQKLGKLEIEYSRWKTTECLKGTKEEKNIFRSEEKWKEEYHKLEVTRLEESS